MLLHLSKPGVSTGVVPTTAAAAASLMFDGGVQVYSVADNEIQAGDLILEHLDVRNLLLAQQG
ncbi:hypothetical protein Dimus_027219, partial [Dionaea muscipula]